MKIVHIVRQFSPSVGGLEDSVLNLAVRQNCNPALAARVVTLDRVFNDPTVLPHADMVDGLPVTRLPWIGSTRYPIAPSVLRTLGDADIVHVHAIDFFFDYLALTRVLHRKPMIASTHGGFFHTAAHAGVKKVWFDTITRASQSRYDAIVACSENDAAIFSRICGRRLITIENGISQAKFLDCGSKVPRRSIVCFGRFASHKRVDLLFPLLAALRRLDASWTLVVAGRPADQSEAMLQRLADGAGVGGAVRFVISPDDENLRSIIENSSYFASLSEHEGFGLAAVEAMSAGLIPILSPIAPFQRLIAQTGVGTLVDPMRLEAAAARIEAMHKAGLDAAHLARQRVMAVAARYDWSDVARRYVALYDRILKKRGRTDQEEVQTETSEWTGDASSIERRVA